MLLGQISKLHVLKRHLAPHVIQHGGTFLILQLGLFVHQAEYTLRRRHGRLQFANDIGKLVDGARKLTGILHKGRHTAQRNEKDGCHADLFCRKHVQNTAKHGDKGNGEIVDKVNGRADDGAVPIRLIIRLYRRIVPLVKAGNNHALAGVRTNGALTRQHFLCIAVQLAKLARARLIKGANVRGFIAGKQNGNRHRQCKHQQKHGRNRRHHQKRTNYRKQADEHVKQVVRKRGVYRIDIIGNMADNITRGVGIKIPYGQGNQPFKHFSSHAENNLLAKAHHQHCQQVRKHCRQHVAHHQQRRIQVNGVKIHLSATKGKRVNRGARELGAHQGKQVGYHHQHQRQ